MQRATPAQLAQAMGQLTPEQLREVGQRSQALNRIIAEERAKTIPDHQALMAAYEGLDALNREFELPATYNMGKVRAEMYLLVTAPTTPQ